jgi:acetyl-CoA C-acetyltransferase
MHAIASMVRALRADPGSFGLVGANGGFLSKYSVGVYSTQPRAFAPFSSAALQAEVDAAPAPALAESVTGQGTVETYTIDYSGPAPKGLIIARTDAGERFVAYTDDPVRVEAMIAHDPLGATVMVGPDDKGRNQIIG